MARSINLRGLDKEIQENIESKYDPQLEQKALDWIAAITKQRAPKVKGCHGDALYDWLSSGVVLCDLLNSIRAGTVPTRQITRKPRHVLEERVGSCFSPTANQISHTNRTEQYRCLLARV